ncbi:uncharacterized protein JCM15063_003195 [Sporobolomyces koalae]|uniref:uncharacterized protein n=1 Tax=Sporobolomyces koalae TaxID=500713 RepID=UPI003176E63B
MASIKFEDLPHTNLLATLPVSTLNEIYSALLERTLAENDPSTKTGIGTRGPVTRFHSKVPPPLSPRDYLERLTKFTPFPRDALLLSSIYLHRISHAALPTAYSSCESFTDDPIRPTDPTRTPHSLFKSFVPPSPDPVVAVSPCLAPVSPDGEARLAAPPLLLSPPPPPPPQQSNRSLKKRPAPLLNLYTLHRLVLSTLLVATKYSVDGTLSQLRAAKVGGVSTTELTRLEAETLRLLGWGLYVGSHEMESCLREWISKGKELNVIHREVERGDQSLKVPIGNEEPGSGTSSRGSSVPSSTTGSPRLGQFSPPLATTIVTNTTSRDTTHEGSLVVGSRDEPLRTEDSEVLTPPSSPSEDGNLKPA